MRRAMIIFLLLLSAFLEYYLVNAKFYIYPWPSELDDVYPPTNASLHPTSTYSHDFSANSGAGTVLDGSIGLFQSWQFSLYKVLMQRLRSSKDRTFDPNEATAFIVPFDAGVHSYIDHKNGAKRLGSPHGWLAKMLLENSPYLKRNNGHDHFMIFSITLYQMIGIGVKMLYQDVCYNCTTLVIESSPSFVHHISGWPYKSFYFAVPYPSSFHWWEGIRELPWQPQNASLTSLHKEEYSKEEFPFGNRDIFVLFIGSTKTATVSANRFRKHLQDQCEQSTNYTISPWASSTSTNFSWCQWHTVSHACNALVKNNQPLLLSLYRRSVFCPAPVGDSLTRKSLFDALVAGCIPVIFDKRSLSQYLWHVPSSLLNDVAVYLPKSTVLNSSISFVKMLYNLVNVSEIHRRQSVLSSYASMWQYALVPHHIQDHNAHIDQIVRELQPNLLLSSPSSTISAVNQSLVAASSFVSWEPTLPDAATVIIEQILYRTSGQSSSFCTTSLSSSSSSSSTSSSSSSSFSSQLTNDMSMSIARISNLVCAHKHIDTSVAAERNEISANSNSTAAYLRHFCRFQNEVVVDGVVYSRGLAWHRLRQLCLSVGLLIQLETGNVVDLQDPEYIRQQKSKKRNTKMKKKKDELHPSVGNKKM